MLFDRREFLGLAVGAAAATALPKPPKAETKAVAFDAFPILDPRPVFALAEELFPGKGAELSAAWRTRQFEYTWLRALSRNYADFKHVTEDALVYAAQATKLDLDQGKRTRLIQAYFELKAYPDVAPVLKALKEKGLRLAFLSNMTEEMLNAGIRNSGLQDVFDHVLSTDAAKTYKPDPRAYQLGVDRLKLKKEEVVFAAFAGWDAAGAKSFGYRTFWVNRQKMPAEQLGALADGEGSGMADLLAFL